MAARLLILCTLGCGLAGAGEARPTAWLPPLVTKKPAGKPPVRPAAPDPAAAEPTWVGANEIVPVPEGAHLSLLLDKPRYFLGENVLVHYVLENRSGQPFTISTGGVGCFQCTFPVAGSSPAT